MRFLLLLAAVSLVCAVSAAEDELPITSAEPVSGPKAEPAFSGKWVGTWVSIANEGQSGKLTCVTVQKANDQWTAMVVAEYSLIDDGPSEKFSVVLKGESKGAQVIFDGMLDLKDKGGVFTWTGSAAGNEFKGKYEGPGENGTFKMMRVVEKNGTAEIKHLGEAK